MINYLEVQRKPYEEDPNATPSENLYIRQHFSCSRAELDALRYEIHCINRALKLDLVIEDWVDLFVVRGDLPDDVLNMVDDIICRYCNDDYDKVDYYYSEI